jgi:putative ABC transport system permease protein
MKILRDLWHNRMRTILVVSSIAVGIFAVGTVQHLRSSLGNELQSIAQETSAAHATIFAPGMDQAMLDSIARTPGVAEVSTRNSVGLKIELAPGTWENFTVTTVEDFADQPIDKIIPITASGKHPEFGVENTRWPVEGEIILENSGLDAGNVLPEGIRNGDVIRVETPDGRIRALTVTGIASDANAFPAAFIGSASGYVVRDTFEQLGGAPTFGQASIRVEGTPDQLMDKAYIESIANQVADKVERSGYPVARTNVPEPGQVGLQDLFDSLALLLTPLGLLALFLSGFLVINTISALMAQQTRQIGVMKSIGGTRRQIVLMYLSAVLSYSVVALLVAIPLTVFVASGLGRAVGNFLNLSLPRFSLPTNVLVLQIAIGILTPLLAALAPVLRGTSVTVREAITDYGVGDGGPSRLSEFLVRLRGLSQPMQLSLRNTFRRRARLLLTLITLVLGGMIFMTVGSVRLSLTNLIEQGISYNQFDISVDFERPYRTARLEEVLLSVPGVTDVEIWTSDIATPVRPDESEGDPITLTALPAESIMVEPTLQAGRWLLPGDESAIVVSQKVLGSEPDLQVGDELVLEINGREQAWTVVGIAQILSGPPNVIPAYVNYPYYSRFIRSVGQGESAQILVAQDDPDSVNAMVDNIQAALDAEGIQVASVFTIERLRRITGGFFDVVVFLLLAMGILIATVGALGLMGTMSTNVLERTREIGVMRSIGASDGEVQRIVIVEGVIIGLISWLIGGALAFPAGAGLSSAVGVVLFQTPLPYTFAPGGVITWLLVVTILAGVASFLPAWNASRLTVREVLAYE